MSAHAKTTVLIPATLVFVGLPLLFWATGDSPRRTVLKETFSILTIVAFCLMLAQFQLVRRGAGAVEALGSGTVRTLHRIIGYTFLGVLLVHPLLIVIPRSLEGGVDPADAFLTLVTTIDSLGVVLGITAWTLLLVLGLTSFARRRLPMKRRTWRILHGVLSLLFVAAATGHAIDLGRHMDVAMSVTLIILATGGAALLLQSYVRNPEVVR